MVGLERWSSGPEVFDQRLEADVKRVGGRQGPHNCDRTEVRHGSDPAKVALETWAAVATRDLLNAHTVAAK